MNSCTFFGHRDCPDSIEPILRETIVRLITREDVTDFYVGDKGNFDRLVLKVLRELETYLYDINYWVVLSHFPFDIDEFINNPHFLCPLDIEFVPPRFAIDYRNNYMLNESDFVITYTLNGAGGAAKFEKKARRQKKTVINIADMMNK